MDLSDEECKNNIERVQSMLFHQIDIPIPGYDDLSLNRTAHPKTSSKTSDIEELTIKGRRRAQERGFNFNKMVEGRGKKALYKAVSQGLTGEESNYWSIYKIGVSDLIAASKRLKHKYFKGDNMSEEDYQRYVVNIDRSGLEILNPYDVLESVAEVLSVRIFVFHARGKTIVSEFGPCGGSKIIRTTCVLCVPDLETVEQAYVLEPISPVYRVNPPEPSNTEQQVKDERIWKKYTNPTSFSTTSEQDALIENLKSSISGFCKLKCLYKEPWN